MELNELKEKYYKAHEVYLKYKDTNGTNCVEEQYIDSAIETLQSIRPDSEFRKNNDNFLNYLGCDILEFTSDKKVYTWDLKICQYETSDNVIIDAYKHNNNILFKATDVKINDYFLFMNADNWVIIPFQQIEKLNIPKEECFYMNRDLKKTTLKYRLDTSKLRRRVITRNK